MKNSSKKIIIILVIIIVLLIAMVGTVAGMVITGKVALTSKQKLAKAFSDIEDSVTLPELEEYCKKYEKMQQTPFESEVSINANVNEISLENSNEMQEIIDEVKNTIDNTQITNKVKADLKNNIIVENLKLGLGDIIPEISLDAQYTGKAIGIRSQELNPDYITLEESSIQSNNQYSNLQQVFEVLEEICQPKSINLYLTDEEKAHFTDNYQGILDKYIIDDMITEENSTILLDGVTSKNCSKVSFTLNRLQIIELLGEYLDKLENDTVGRQIIIQKINSLTTFEDSDLQDLIIELKADLLNLDNNTSIKVSVYCTMFNTYGFDIEFISDVNDKISVILGKNKKELYVAEDDEEIMNVIKSGDEIVISSKNDKSSITLDITKVDSKDVISLNINDTERETQVNIILSNEKITKTENNETSKGTIQFVATSGENVIDFTVNIDTKLDFVNSVDTVIEDVSFIDLVNSTETEMQDYMSKVTTSMNQIIQNAIQNSKLINMIYSLYGNNVSTINDEEVVDTPTHTQTVEATAREFNNMFASYTGNLDAVKVRLLLSQISNNNLTNTHKVGVSITDNGNILINNTEDYTQISLANSLVDSNSVYIIYVNEVDEAGYIKKIEIRKK